MKWCGVYSLALLELWMVGHIFNNHWLKLHNNLGLIPLYTILTKPNFSRTVYWDLLWWWLYLQDQQLWNKHRVVWVKYMRRVLFTRRTKHTHPHLNSTTSWLCCLISIYIWNEIFASVVPLIVMWCANEPVAIYIFLSKRQEHLPYCKNLADYMPLSPPEDEDDTVVNIMYPLEPPVSFFHKVYNTMLELLPKLSWKFALIFPRKLAVHYLLIEES